MKNSKKELQEIEEEERKNKEQAAKIQKKRNSVYQGLSIGCVEEIFKFRDEIRETFKTFQAVNERLAELENLYPGYLGFLQKVENWNTDFDASEVRYIVDYLLTSKWSKTGEYWRVIGQIADTINVPSNPFRLEDGE